jgi:hypothetical protein
MSRQLNVDYLVPLTAVFPANRLGPKGDVAKVACGTCHQGVNKPLERRAAAEGPSRCWVHRLRPRRRQRRPLRPRRRRRSTRAAPSRWRPNAEPATRPDACKAPHRGAFSLVHLDGGLSPGACNRARALQAAAGQWPASSAGVAAPQARQRPSSAFASRAAPSGPARAGSALARAIALVPCRPRRASGPPPRQALPRHRRVNVRPQPSPAVRPLPGPHARAQPWRVQSRSCLRQPCGPFRARTRGLSPAGFRSSGPPSPCGRSRARRR